MATQNPEPLDPKRLKEHLRAVVFPGYSRDIVSFGFVDEIVVPADGVGEVTVHFSPNTTNDEKAHQMVADIQAVLGAVPGVLSVNVALSQPYDEEPVPGVANTPNILTPLQAELISDGITPEQDPMLKELKRPDLAPEVGYGEDGPSPLGSNLSREELQTAISYTGDVPVFQWEVDPQSQGTENRQALVNLDEWEFRVWWIEHPAKLIFASIQALQNDEKSDGKRRKHPMGRNVVVNLVYDELRKGITAIYGTARDFRPFVQAFLAGYDGFESDGDPADQANQDGRGNGHDREQN